ncbi:hypothetical protein [Alicyclobacillus sp. ALC3]|uniref:hypothetical protein n=1 Tax=Alicyclobacillus sp. ALC3 TaxID=2796143 RepID=UPI002378A54E|nr:hypothetical protein [Alicyclobacillus sp. ALC3]WDL95636.1 hypothetical protein JC200_14770 [Alicyclobacillus sp. ALC3]
MFIEMAVAIMAVGLAVAVVMMMVKSPRPIAWKARCCVLVVFLLGVVVAFVGYTAELPALVWTGLAMLGADTVGFIVALYPELKAVRPQRK